MSYDPTRFAEKFLLARDTALKETPKSGLCGFELEWNLLDSQFRPLLTVGSGPSRQSFVDYLRATIIPESLRPYSQLEVFHWMIEWATRPYFYPRGAVYEARMMEASLMNALHKAGREFDEQLYTWHGNLLYLADIGPHSIPGSWHIAKRRYLERCVALYGTSLATAGIHTNLSLPDPLMAWDFMHLTSSERGDQLFDDYKSQVYITGTRLMRAFAALFIALSASTPLQAQTRDWGQAIVLTAFDSVRNLTFPNPTALDMPDLYRSYTDYLNISYDLVRRGVRFGNNNWTPVRARSFAEPVERLITTTSDQLQDMYAHGLFAIGGEVMPPDARQVEEMAHQIEIQNLLARINLPMSRVEVRTDDGGGTLELDVANLTLKYLLLLRFYADPQFARSFRYDHEDIQRARRNEEQAARYGLRAEIENPLTGKPVPLRHFLSWTLEEVRPLAEALDLWDDLTPLRNMAGGAPNQSQRLRQHLLEELGGSPGETLEIPLDMLKKLAAERQAQVGRDIETILGSLSGLDGEAAKVKQVLLEARRDVLANPLVPIQFQIAPQVPAEILPLDKTAEIVELAQQLIRIPSVTACPQERLDEVQRIAGFICDYLRFHGLAEHYLNKSKYPAVLAGFPNGGKQPAPAVVMLSGHYDVVPPDPDDSQFQPRIDGDYLWGRGSADMKTVVATYLVWMKDTLRLGPPYPPVNLLLVGNEENGEMEPVGTPHALCLLKEAWGFQPELLIAGERTGERGDEKWGEVCTQNRGVMRFELIARGQRGHTGVGEASIDLGERLIQARQVLAEIFQRRLTLKSADSWKSQASFPYLQVGTPGVYNVSADYGVLGVEVRPIPQDDLDILLSEVQAACKESSLELSLSVKENGIACDPANPYLLRLLQAVREVSGEEPKVGRKLAGTSARFAPAGQGVVWGQSGIGPHARDERHYIPSILPYYRALERFARLLKS
jgi:succinyl-diaminopimelate desuccinylase